MIPTVLIHFGKSAAKDVRSPEAQIPSVVWVSINALVYVFDLILKVAYLFLQMQ